MRRSQAMSFVRADIDKLGTLSERTRDYAQPNRPKPAKRALWFRILSRLRGPRATKLVLDHSANGASVDRFRKILERANCGIEKVEVSGTIVVIDFVFLDDDGHCTAILTDRLANGSYLRCCLAARFGGALPLDQVNELNQHSKFLKFYMVRNNTLFVEYSFVLVDLPDSAAAANVEVFHDSIGYVVANDFAYEGMSSRDTA